MRRLFTLFLLAFVITSVSWAQSMTDDQVVEYVKSAQQAGVSQQQMTKELMRRGVKTNYSAIFCMDRFSAFRRNIKPNKRKWGVELAK